MAVCHVARGVCWSPFLCLFCVRGMSSQAIHLTRVSERARQPGSGGRPKAFLISGKKPLIFGPGRAAGPSYEALSPKRVFARRPLARQSPFLKNFLEVVRVDRLLVWPIPGRFSFPVHEKGLLFMTKGARSQNSAETISQAHHTTNAGIVRLGACRVSIRLVLQSKQHCCFSGHGFSTDAANKGGTITNQISEYAYGRRKEGKKD